MKKFLSILFVLSLIAGLAGSLSAVPAMASRPPLGNTPSVGIALTAMINGVPTVGPVKVGDVITYRITLYVPTSPPLPDLEVAFYFYGGELSIQLPGTHTFLPVAGYGGLTPLHPTIPEVTDTSPFTVDCPALYTVKVSDLNPSAPYTGKLYAEADYGSTGNYPTQSNGYFEEATDIQEANASSASGEASIWRRWSEREPCAPSPRAPSCRASSPTCALTGAGRKPKS